MSSICFRHRRVATHTTAITTRGGNAVVNLLDCVDIDFHGRNDRARHKGATESSHTRMRSKYTRVGDSASTKANGGDTIGVYCA